MAIQPGQMLSHYRLAEKIGEGGMGVVWRAQDTHLDDRDVAVKVLPTGVLANEEARARFRKEALALSKINHPNVAVVHDFDSHDGIDFLVMEYIPGTTLTDRIAEGPLPEAEVLDLGLQLADGLAAAHEESVLHRDLKPGNLRITPRGQLKILDFGLAKILREPSETAPTETQTKGLVGTVPYMAPEQVSGGRVDERTDLYAAGATLFEMATGKRAHSGESAAEIVGAILQQTPRAPTDLNPDLSRPLEGVILKALVKDPGSRYQTTRELQSDLERVQTGLVTSVRRRASARRIALLLATIVVLIAAAVATYFMRQKFQPDPESVAQATMLAVLPFQNLSGNPEQDYFSDGITSEMINRLDRLDPESTEVIAWTSARQYKGTDKTVSQIAAELGAAYLLEGSVRTSTDRVRISVQLINAEDQTPVWSESYNRTARDIFAIQDEIVGQVVAAIGVTLIEGEAAELTRVTTTDPRAFDYYLKGLDFLDNRASPSREECLGAIEMFEKAVALDPGFAAAHALLAQVHAMMHRLDQDPSAARLAMAKRALDTAVNLQPDLPETRYAAGNYYLWGFRNYERASAEFAASLRVAPNRADTVRAAAEIHLRQGRFEDALAGLNRAFELSPLEARFLAYMGRICVNLRQYERARDYYERLAAIDPAMNPERKAWLYYYWKGSLEEVRALLDTPGKDAPDWVSTSYLYLSRQFRQALDRLTAVTVDPLDLYGVMALAHEKARVYQALGEYDRAKAEAASVLSIAEQCAVENERCHNDLALTYAHMGRFEDAIRESELQVELYPIERDAWLGPTMQATLAEIYTMAGEYESAIGKIEFLVTVPAGLHLWELRLDPLWDPLREHPRFKKLLKSEES